MTASAWLHKCKYHHIPELTEQIDNRSKSSELSDAFVDIPFMLDSGDMVQGRRGMLKICDGDRSAFTCNNRDMFLQTSAPSVMAALASNIISNPWFFEPLQIFATLGAAINFGGSVLQSPLIMPTVTDHVVGVPVHYTAQQTAYLLHNSEHFFPPLNALCSLSNLILTGTAFLRARDGNLIAEAKFPKLATAFGLNIATTAWALLIQVPMNKRMSKLAEILKAGVANGTDKDSRQKAAATEFRELQLRWRKLNYGRAAIMIASAVAGALALVAKP
ncbi:hypothetical protein E4T52_13565 [Aureobasidium sp. EXF-3400]|nr:hypothetical protein E4T52_13565 [Aureobasidium sp. EXF-3400]